MTRPHGCRAGRPQEGRGERVRLIASPPDPTAAAPAGARDLDRSFGHDRPGGTAATFLVLGLALLGAAAAEAQTTPRILVSNAGQGSDNSANTNGNDHAQLFHTAGHALGYMLTSVIINSEDPEGDAFDVEICAEDGTANEFPSTTASDCTALTAPGSFTAGNLTFTHAGLALSANTNYVVVIKPRSGASVLIDSTTSGGEDATGLSGWSIKGYFYWNNSGTWTNQSGTNEALRITVNGYENVDAVTFTCSADSMVNRIWTGNLTVGSWNFTSNTSHPTSHSSAGTILVTLPGQSFQTRISPSAAIRTR